MKATSLATGIVAAAALAAVPLGASPLPPDEAVDSPAAMAQLERITVFAPRIVLRRVQVGQRVRVVEQRASVDYGDLNLASAEDMQIMQTRINDAATHICTELSAIYPDAKPSIPVCIRQASEDAMRLARAVAAEKAMLAELDDDE